MNQTGKKPVRPAPAGEPTTTKREVTARVRNGERAYTKQSRWFWPTR